MRSRKGAILSQVLLLFAAGFVSNGVRAVPLGATYGHNIALQEISDTCDWWGTRWQYGWRGYGWYLCWEQAKPFPTFIDPQETPAEAVRPAPAAVPQSCIKKRRDNDGKLHARRVC